MNVTEWLRFDPKRRSEVDLGPAKVVLARTKPEPSGRNEIVLILRPDSQTLDYVIYNKDRSIRKSGEISQSETLETGWMGLKFRLLRYLPHSREVVRYVPSPTSSPLSSPAIRIAFRGRVLL